MRGTKENGVFTSNRESFLYIDFSFLLLIFRFFRPCFALFPFSFIFKLIIDEIFYFY